jgi:hypothetical protein
VKGEIQRIKAERSRIEPPNTATQHEFASPVGLQCTELTKRLFTQYWRDPSYLYGKLFTSVIIGIFNGFTFWQLGYTEQDMQDRMFTSFLVVLIPNSTTIEHCGKLESFLQEFTDGLLSVLLMLLLRFLSQSLEPLSTGHCGTGLRDFQVTHQHLVTCSS